MANGLIVTKKLSRAFTDAGITMSQSEVSVIVSRLHGAHFESNFRSFSDPFNVFDWSAEDCKVFVQDWQEMSDNEFRENYLIERQV